MHPRGCAQNDVDAALLRIKAAAPPPSDVSQAASNPASTAKQRAAWVPWRAKRAADDLARATPRPTGGDGDGLLADGRTPVKCRAHRVLLERRQRHAARVETVGRGAPVGTGVALRPPFTPRKIAAKSSSDRAAAPPAERNP